MQWTDHDKILKERLKEKLSEDEWTWWLGVLERTETEAAREAREKKQKEWQEFWDATSKKMIEAANAEVEEAFGRGVTHQHQKWLAWKAGRSGTTVIRRERDTRGIFEKGWDFTFGED